MSRIPTLFELLWTKHKQLYLFFLLSFRTVVQPLRTNFLLRLGQSKALYQAFEKIRNGALFDTLNEAQQRVVEGRLKDTILNGVALEHEKKVHFNEIQQELEKLLNKFSENVLDSTKLFGKLVIDISVLEGLPETALALAAQAAVSNEFHNYALLVKCMKISFSTSLSGD